MSEPLVSVIIPTFNGARWLGDCLASVLHQAYAPIEVVVIDDGSTDETPAILRRFEPRVRVIQQERAGIGAARNRGIAAASGEYLAFLDHDDLWQRDKLQKQLDHAEQLDLVYTDATEFAERGVVHCSFFERFPGLREPARLFDKLVYDGAIPLMSTVLLRADFLRRHRLRFLEPVSGVDDLD